MPYATALIRNRYARLALEIGWNYRLRAPQIHKLAAYLAEQPDRHDQYLTQIGVKWAKNAVA